MPIIKRTLQPCLSVCLSVCSSSSYCKWLSALYRIWLAKVLEFGSRKAPGRCESKGVDPLRSQQLGRELRCDRFKLHYSLLLNSLNPLLLERLADPFPSFFFLIRGRSYTAAVDIVPIASTPSEDDNKQKQDKDENERNATETSDG